MLSEEEMTMIESFVEREFDSYRLNRQNTRVLQLYPASQSVRADFESHVDQVKETIEHEFPEYNLSVYRLIQGPIEISGD